MSKPLESEDRREVWAMSRRVYRRPSFTTPEDETDNDDEYVFEVVESDEEGKEKATPTPSPGLGSSPSVAAAVVPLVEEKKEKGKGQEKKTQEQTQAMTAVEAKEIRANTPSIWIADTPQILTTSLVVGVPRSVVPVAPSLSRVTSLSKTLNTGQFTTDLGCGLDGDWGTLTKEELKKSSVSVPAKSKVGGDEVRFLLCICVFLVGLELMVRYRDLQRHRNRPQR